MAANLKANHFGDILAPREIASILPPGFNGLERIILSANGNLQRIMSAYYNSPVTVKIHKNERMGQTNVFQREVTLCCLDQVWMHSSPPPRMQNWFLVLFLLCFDHITKIPVFVWRWCRLHTGVLHCQQHSDDIAPRLPGTRP